MYWNALGVNDWPTTEAAVRGVIDLQQRQLQDQHYDHTNVPDRRIVAYNENGGAVDVIWSPFVSTNLQLCTSLSISRLHD
jgi:hypothetical protein